MNVYRLVIKILNSFLGVCAMAWCAGAQNLSSEVIGTAGNDMIASNATLSYTIGEPAVSYWNASGKILTEGFQQSEVLITSVFETPQSLNVTVFPNPFSTSFTVAFDRNASYDLVVTDALGRCVNVKKEITGNNQCKVDMQAISAGLYYLSLYDDNHQPVAVYRLVKSTP